MPGPPSDRDARLRPLRALVEAFAARSAREQMSRMRFLEELDRLTEPFSRDADPVHVTASAIVLGPRGTVLHLHKRLGLWLQPGGHVEGAETPEEAALREAREETGLPLRHPPGGPHLVHLDVHPAGEHTHLDLRYLLHSDDVDPRPLPGESADVRWFSVEDALALADEALIDGLRRAAAAVT